MEILNFITSNILRNPPVLLGLITAVGLMLQKKKVSDIVKGAALAAFGMVILNQGVGMLVGSILPINNAFGAITGGAIGEGLNDATFLANFGSDAGLAMIIALGIHLLIARFTPIKSIFLTGHMIWWFPVIFVAAGVEAGLSGMPLIMFAAIISALYFSVMPWVLRKFVFAVTGDESFTLGHPTGFLSLISGYVARVVGDKKKSTEDLKIPAGLSFFREVSITGGAVILILFIVTGIMNPALAGEKNLFFVSLEQAFAFGAGLTILLLGVRMLIGQLVPAFKGIATKVVPNALPALDCPVIFTYKPNAVLIGFVVAMIVSTITIVICNVTNVFGVLMIPLVITSFFECGTAAVIGEGQGGLRGAVIGTSVAAIAMVLALGVSAVAFSTTLQNWLLIFGGNDFSLFGVIAKWIGSLFAGIF